MKKYLIAATALSLIAPAAHALTLDETDTRNVGFAPTELNATLNFDGYDGSGTVTEVRLGFRGVIDSDISIFNRSTTPNSFGATTVSEFEYTSPAGNTTFNVGADVGTQTLGSFDSVTFEEVGGDESVSLTFTGAGVNPFLSPFTVGLLTDTFLQLSGGGGQVLGGQDTQGFGEVTVEYLIEDTIAPVPLPATAWMMLAALGSFLGFRRYKNA